MCLQTCKCARSIRPSLRPRTKTALFRSVILLRTLCPCSLSLHDEVQIWDIKKEQRLRTINAHQGVHYHLVCRVTRLFMQGSCCLLTGIRKTSERPLIRLGRNLDFIFRLCLFCQRHHRERQPRPRAQSMPISRLFVTDAVLSSGMGHQGAVETSVHCPNNCQRGPRQMVTACVMLAFSRPHRARLQATQPQLPAVERGVADRLQRARVVSDLICVCIDLSAAHLARHAGM